MVKAADKKSLGPVKVQEVKGVSEYKLANGLKVLIAENHSAPVATLLIVYKVGSRNEGVGYTGATHFLEHMLFKGTEKHNTESGNGIDDLLTQIGAYWNATTWFDRTSYYEVVPNDFFELCVELEADRMRNLRLRQEDHDSEMSVVRNELERGENHPEEALEKELYAIAFREHPYHHPTIGWRSDVEGVAMDRLRQFYNTFYWPNNATVIALGDFETDNAIKIINAHFGSIPSSPEAIPEVYTVEPPQEGERRFEISRIGDLPRVWVGYHVPQADHPDSYAIAAARQLLGSTYERSSRLYKRLIDTSMAAEVFARHDDLRDPGLVIVGAVLNPGIDINTVELALLDEVEKLAVEAATQDELRRIKSSNLKGTILAKADPSSLAFMLGEAESRADYQWLLDYDDKFDAVTAEDIMRVVKQYFVRSNRTVGHFLPKEGLEGEYEMDDEDEEVEVDADELVDELVDMMGSPEHHLQPPAATASTASAALTPHKLYSESELKALLVDKPSPVTVQYKDAAKSDYLSRVQKHVLKNGITVLIMEAKGSESVGLAMNMRAGRYFTASEPCSPSELVGDLISRGSKRYDKIKLAENLEEMGIPGGLEFYVDNYRVGIGTHLVTSDLKLYLEMLADIVREPSLDQEELLKTKVEWNSRFVESKMNTKSMAWNRLRQALYAPDHPFYDKDFDLQVKELEAITRDDLIAAHSKLYSPDATIITLVGDIDSALALKEIETYFGDWQPQKTALKDRSVVIPDTTLAASKRVEVFLPEKSSVDIVIAHPSTVRRDAPDFYAARIANAALGQDTITSRLGQVVRDRAGLTYGIYSSFADTAFGGAPWTVSLTTNPKNVDRALQLTNATLKDYLDRGINKEDLAKESGRALGSFKVGLASSLGIARVLTEFEFLGLGAGELDAISSRYLDLTKADVDKAMQTYFHPDKAVTVISGTIIK